VVSSFGGIAESAPLGLSEGGAKRGRSPISSIFLHLSLHFYSGVQYTSSTGGNFPPPSAAGLCLSLPEPSLLVLGQPLAYSSLIEPEEPTPPAPLALLWRLWRPIRLRGCVGTIRLLRVRLGRPCGRADRGGASEQCGGPRERGRRPGRYGGGSTTPRPTPGCLHDTHSALGTNALLCYFVATPLATVRE
jgi:hypothetical protein